MKINRTATLATLALLPLAGLAQTAAEINPFNRGFVTAEQMARQAPAPAVGPPPAAPVAVMPTPAGSRPGSAAPAPAQSATPPSVAAPVAQVAPPTPPRFVPESARNRGSQNYFEDRGAAKAGHYGSVYGQSSSRPNAASSQPAQVEILAPFIAELRSRGVDEGKISVELNRLTPAQFVHWAQQTSR